MSLILEALRKSEAERRLGNAPDVMTAMPVMRVPVPRRRWPVATAGAAVSLATIALGWWFVHGGSTTSAVSRASRPTPPPAGADPANRAASAASTLARQAIEPPRPSIAPPDRASTGNPVTSAAPQTPATAAAAHPMPAPHPATPRELPTVDASATTPAAPAIALPPVPATAPPPEVAASAEQALLPVNTLPSSERGALPALKVTMHVFAENPADRFMIVDGQRVVEGDRLADGVVLVHIRRDGAEIEVHGRRLLLPNP